jgi:hypothetical protein
MLQANVRNQKLMYLGSIDDKVVEYQKIRNPEKQLLHTLFFSAVLGDPLVLNDGYLLHSKWGRAQLMHADSAVRQLNQQHHLLLVARSSEPYSVWIPEQAERTQSYRDLMKRLEPGEIELLDEAWSQCVGRPWPTLNLQSTMHGLLRSHAHALLEREIAPVKLEEHHELFEGRIAGGETVRAAWEAAMLEMGDRLSRDDRFSLMEFVNEAYHASFACGFAAAGEGVEVGIAGYGRRRLQDRGAYQQADGQSFSALQESEEFQDSVDALNAMATVHVTSREDELFAGSKLVEFLKNESGPKATYREGLQRVLRSEQPAHERIQAMEHILLQYRKTLEDYFPYAHNPDALLRLVDFADKGARLMARYRPTLDLAGKLLGMAAPHLPPPAVDLARVVSGYWGDGQDFIEGGLPLATNVYISLQSRNMQTLHLLPHLSRAASELSLDPAFVSNATDGIPTFK